MKKYLPLALAFAVVACAPLKPHRTPSSLDSLETRISEANKLSDQLQKLKASGSVEIHVEFKDSGKDKSGKGYEIKADVFSNDLSAIESAEVMIGDRTVHQVNLESDEAGMHLNIKVPFMLPIDKTKIRFHLGAEGTRDVELFCTRVGKCL
jgi:hypothetical protein